MKLKTKLFLSLFSVVVIFITVIFILIPYETVLSFVENNMIIVSVVSSSSLILIIIIYVILVRTISKPIRKLNKAVSFIDNEETEKLKKIYFKRKN